MAFVQFLTFLKEHHLDAVAADSIRLYKEKDLPIMKYYANVSEEVMLASTKQSFLKFIEDFENGREYISIEEGQKRWLNNENPVITREQVKVEDLVKVYATFKESLLNFLHLYTDDVQECMYIVKEFEEYFNVSYLRSIETYVLIQSEVQKASEKKYRLLAENSSDIISIHNPEGIITYVSPSCSLVLGYEPGEMVGKNVSDFAYLNTHHSADEKNKRAANHSVETTTTQMVRKDGLNIWLEATSKNITCPDSDGIIEVHTIARNITTRKNAEDRLLQHKLLLHESQRIAKIGSWEWNLRTNELVWSKGHYALYGMDPAATKVTYEMASLLRHPDDTPVIRDTIAEALKNNSPFEFVHRLIVDGNVVMLQVKGEITVRDGDTILMGTSQDITRINQLQKLMAQKNHHLDEAQRIAHMGSWEWNVKSGAANWSNEMFRIFGYENFSEHVDMNTYLGHVFPKDREKVKACIEECTAHEKAVCFDHRIIKRDGSVRWLQTTLKAVERKSDKGEKGTTICGTALDITDRKLIELAQDERIKDLERAVGFDWHMLNNARPEA